MKITLVHYWLESMRGGEKVLENIIDVFPNSGIITNYYNEKKISRHLLKRISKTSFIQDLPFVKLLYRHYLPLYPLALKRIKIKNSDLVISSESGPAKGIQVGDNIPHICYTHTPMRYIWDMQEEYFGKGMKRMFLQPVINYLRNWDYNSAQKLDCIIANSQYVKERIARFWKRESEVIYPPVDTNKFSISKNISEYYLIFGQSTKYKRHDIAVKAFNENKRQLIIIGEGEELPNLKSNAKKNITFLGRVEDNSLKKHLSKCKALIFPGIEDFGIVPVEAMASGRPVIAFDRGGAKETIIDKKTGLFFNEQTPKSLNKKIDEFESIAHSFDPGYIKKHSEKFDKEIFKNHFKKYVEDFVMNYKKNFLSNK
tara:strand:+ start:132978 stop:134087 length:1110 start_codon:yes stop_codon:yes gene_type:complete